MIQALKDTTIIVEDSIIEKSIQIHQSIQLVERPKTTNEIWIENLSIWVPIFIAGLALFFSFRESRKNRKERYEEKRLSVKPILLVNIDSLDGDIFVSLENKGLGTAKITDFYYTYEGEKYDYFFELLVKLTNKNFENYLKPTTRCFNFNIDDVYYIASNEDIELFKIFFNEKLSLVYKSNFKKKLKDVNVYISYYNLYDEHIDTLKDNLDTIEVIEKKVQERMNNT